MLSFMIFFKTSVVENTFFLNKENLYILSTYKCNGKSLLSAQFTDNL